ncbi:MAG: hypothetical protein KDC07_10480 [Chitinophagaceae bacterium]|nr:hypothetical protein [Chitinophagaceae bacterium]MCB9045615.1 hypothetical protein [Chitinophagales bacterium]
MKNIFTLLFAALFFVGCTKNTTTEDACKDGKIHFVNKSANPYNITIDNMEEPTIAGRTETEKTVFKGSYYIVATQASGYKVNPVVKEYHITVKGCDVVEVLIPVSPYDSVK